MRISDWSSDVCSSDLPDGFAAITGPSTSGFPDTPSMGGMSSPQRVTLPRPSLAIRALGNMSYGATASDIAAFNAIGSNDVERMPLWVDAQLDWEAIDDSAFESRLAAAGYTTLGKSLTQLWNDHVKGARAWEVRMRPAGEFPTTPQMR